MSVPYDPAFTAILLRRMTAEQLARVTPASFQPYWAAKILPSAIGRELIDAERAMRRK